MSTTIHCQTALAAAIPDVNITVWSKNGVGLIASGKTDASGNFVFTTPTNEIYYVEARKSLAQFPAQSYLTISGDGQTLNIEGELEDYTPPSLPLRCHIYGYVFGADGKGARMAVLVEVKPKMVAGGGDSFLQLTDSVAVCQNLTLYSDPNSGVWELDIVYGAKVRIYIPDLGFEKVFTVPNKGVLNIIDAIPDVGAQSVGIVSDSSLGQENRNG